MGEQTLRRRRGRSAGRLNLDAMSVPERQMAFAAAALGPLRAVAADPEAERARLEGLAGVLIADRVPGGTFDPEIVTAAVAIRASATTK